MHFMTADTYIEALRKYFMPNQQTGCAAHAWRIKGRRIHDIEIIDDYGSTFLGLPFIYRVCDNWQPQIFQPHQLLSEEELNRIHVVDDLRNYPGIRCNLLYPIHVLQTIETPDIINPEIVEAWDAQQKWVLRIYHTKLTYCTFAQGPDLTETPTAHKQRKNLAAKALSTGYVNAANHPALKILGHAGQSLSARIFRFLPLDAPLSTGSGDRVCMRAYRMLAWEGMQRTNSDFYANSAAVERMQQLVNISGNPRVNMAELLHLVTLYPHIAGKALKSIADTGCMLAGVSKKGRPHAPDTPAEQLPPWVMHNAINY